MYTTIITSIFFLLTLIEELAFLAFDGIMKDAKLKNYFLFKKIVRAIFLIEFTVFNFLFSFAKPEYVFQLVFQIIGNIAAIIYFFLDYFYFSQRTRSYVLWMQNLVFNKTPLSKVFDVYDANGVEYKERKKIPQQRYSIVVAGKDKGLCIFIPTSDGGVLLKPIKPMNEETMMFYAQKIEIDFDNKGSLKFWKGDLPIEAIKEFDYGSESKIYLWIKNRLLSEKGKLILTFTFIGLFLIFVFTFIIADQVFHYDLLNEWFTQKIL